MSYRGFGRTLISAAVGAGVAAISGSALASGFAIGTQNASGLGNAYAGAAAVAEDASTIFYNPAGMTLLSGRQAVGALVVLKPFVGFTNNGSTTPTSPLPSPPGYSVGGNGGDAGSWAAVPTAYLSWELARDTVWLGLGINSPFGLSTEYDSNWVGRFHAVKSDLLTVNINPSVAFKVNEMFSLGGGVSAQYIDAELTRQVAYGAITLGRVLGGNPAGCGGAVATSLGGCAAEGTATVKGDDWSWGWNLGAMINFSPKTRVGLAYRSSIRHSLKGDATFSNVPNYAALGPATAPIVQALTNSGVTADVEVPQSFSVAFSHQFADGLQVLADYTWTGWDSIQALTINRTNGAAPSVEALNFKNSYRVGLGANYQFTPQWKGRIGTAYDTTPVQDQYRSPRLPDADRFWFAIGAQWAFSKQGVIDFGYAHEFVDSGASNLPSLPTPAAPTDVPKGNLVGTYKSDVNIFGVQIRYSF